MWIEILGMGIMLVGMLYVGLLFADAVIEWIKQLNND